MYFFFFFQAEDGIRYRDVTGVQTCALPIFLDGVESAVDQAKSAAGSGYVLVMGGASAGQQCLQAGLVDEMQIHLAPVLFGNGIRLLENIDAERIGLETTRVIETPAATHLQYRILRHPS